MCYLTRSLERRCLAAAWRLGPAVLLGAAVMLVAPRLCAVEPEWIMYHDPQLPKPAFETGFPPGLLALWLQALERPERDLKRRAAEAIVRAQQEGLTGLDAAIEPLMRELQRPEQERLVRLAVVQALVALDARQAAPLLCAALDEGDLDLAELVEPALGRWQHAAMRDVWRARVARDVTLHRMHVLAIRGLAALGDTAALPRLLALAEDRHTPTGVRLEAAAALGKLQQSGLEEPARVLSQDQSPEALVRRLIAARMLAGHRSPDAVARLTELAADPQPSVQAVALEALYHQDPQLVMPLIDQTVKSPDVNVRRWGAATLIAQPSSETIARLAPLLDDLDPALRIHVCDSLVQLAQDAALHDAVITQGRALLDAEGWRAQEQAILLLVTLDDKSIVDRLLVLLDAERAEVMTTAAWGLCRLEVPATAARICEVFQTKTERCLAGGKQRNGTYTQLSHLAQALGRLRHAPADPVLRKYIPKQSVLHTNTRAASIWALGHLHAETSDSELAQKLLERVLDDDFETSMLRKEPPEDTEVRRMAAVALGRMRATETVDGLRTAVLRNGIQSPTGYAAAWAIHAITGEEIPTVRPIENWIDGWFLTPLKEPPAADNAVDGN